MRGDKDIVKALANVTTHVEKAAGGKSRRVADGLMTVGSPDSEGDITDQQSAFEAMPAFMAIGAPVTYNHAMRAGNIGHGFEYEAMRRAGDSFVPHSGMLGEIDAIRLRAEIGQGYEIVYDGALYNVDNIWSQLAQGNTRAYSIHYLGYNGGETEDGDPIIKVRRILECAVATIPVQQEAAAEAFEMARAAGVTLCRECTKRVESELTSLATRATPEQVAAMLANVRGSHRARSHQRRTVSRQDVSGIAKAIHDAAKVLRED